MKSNRVLEILGSRGENALVFAHRGASAFAPENTMEAAERDMRRARWDGSWTSD